MFSCRTARATAMACRWPPDSFAARVSTQGMSTPMSSRNQLGGAHRPVAEKPEPAAAGVFAVEKQIVVHAQLANQRQILEHSLDAVLACVLHRTEPNLLALKIDAATVRRFAVRSERSCYNQCRRSIRYARQVVLRELIYGINRVPHPQMITDRLSPFANNVLPFALNLRGAAHIRK